MKRLKAASAVTAAAVAALVMSACSGGGNSGGTDQNGSSTDVKSMAVGKAEDANAGTFKLANVPGWNATVTVGIDDAFSAYNNQTPDTNSSYNEYVLIPVLSGASMLDGNNKVLLNTDVMQSWDVTSTSPYTVTWKIKPGLKWSDGAPYNCKDYYLSYLAQSGKNPGFNPASPAGYNLIDSAKCTDDTTFVTTFSQPYSDYKGLFDSNAILPAHILEQQTGISDITTLTPTSDPALLKKAGDFWTNGWKGFNKDLDPASGPYMMTAFDQNAGAVTLQKNPNWAGGKGGPSTVVVRKFSDQKAMATALQNGEIQVMASTQPDATAADTLKGLSAQGVIYGSAPQLTYEHLDMNYRNPILQNKAAREALFQVINRSEITDKLLKEVESDVAPMNSLIYTPAELAYQDAGYGKETNQGAAAAKKTLETDGWTLGSDGIYQKNGQRFSVTISHSNIPRRDQTVQIIQSQAQAAGIEVKNDNDPTFLSGGRLSTGNWGIALFAWSQPPFKSQSQPIYSTNGDQNHQKYSNPQVDALFKQAVAATDEGTATKLYQQIDQLMAQDYASLPIYSLPSMWAFQGVDRVYMQSYYGALWNLGEWQQKS
ncbi:MAG TPA: ABC transporter family substrate-binding protein [Amycolatopsis sp.]|nr:ABC transporter family substrate-binding protein [Amycolatopsis sp.]